MAFRESLQLSRVVKQYFLEFIVSAVVGVISDVWATWTVSLLIGLVTFFSIELVKLNIWAISINAQYETVSLSLKELEATDKFSEIILLYGLGALGKLSKSSITVERENIRDFWRNCIARANNKWSAITYARPDETWGLSWAKEALAVQRERIISGCEIERVFVVDSMQELAVLKQLMVEHRQTGITVSWLLESDLMSLKVAKECRKSIGTLDVAVVDDYWIYRTMLDRNQRIVSANATRDKGICRNATTLVKEAQGMARQKGNFI